MFRTYVRTATAALFTHTLSRRQQTSLSAEYEEEEDVEISPAIRANPLLSKAVIIAGSASKILTADICSHLGVKQGQTDISRFSDGEVSCSIKESVRGKHVFVIQTCAAPVNDNIMELLLTVTAARRAGAARVTAVIPYFGYKYHKRGLPISTAYQSRFLWSAAFDFAKMLQAVGVDSVLSVDLQRPGQGHEASLFDSNIPAETWSSNDILVKHVHDTVQLGSKPVVVAANSNCVKKARKFQQKLQRTTDVEIGFGVFIRADPMSISNRLATSEFLGDVKEATVIIIDDIVDTAGTLSTLTRQMAREGATKVVVCASHGVFSSNCMDLIDLSPVDRVIVTDSVQLPKTVSTKVEQVSVAMGLANIIEAELRHMSENYRGADNEIYALD